VPKYDVGLLFGYAFTTAGPAVAKKYNGPALASVAGMNSAAARSWKTAELEDFDNGNPRGSEIRALPQWQAPQKVERVQKTKKSSSKLDSPEISGSFMAAYLRDVRRHQVMLRSEERDVAMCFVNTRDPKFAAQLVNANLRLVVKIVLEYRTERRNLMDLVQEGNAGLMHAVEKYDPARGTRLSTYASWWIRAFVLKYIMSNARLVRVGTTQAQRRLFYGMRKVENRLQMDSSPIEDLDIALAMDVPVEVVAEMKLRLSSSEASLDAPSRHDNTTFGDSFRADPTLQPDNQCETQEFRKVLAATVAAFGSTLTGRELEIYRGRIVCEKPLTLATIAGRFGVSRERVRQLEEGLKEKIRRHLAATMQDSLPDGSSSTVRTRASVRLVPLS